MTERWVVLDVGETIIDETRVWSIWADMLGIPRLTFLAGFGAVLARGGEHRDVFELFNVADWRTAWPEHEAIYGGFQPDDVYPDAIPAMDALRARGYRVAVIGNQPASRVEELRHIGVEAEVIAMSAEMGAAKPSQRFFDRSLELIGSPAPSSVAYVGDRVDNDVLPAVVAGMRAVWIRRGPWGFIERLPDGVQPALIVESLAELAERIDDAWSGLPDAEGNG
ncbi:MAG TPA: HAD family hydrolase [Candidatus Limnocylindria bacterium]|nr:HAD family hydrolase [Candidatus Limnocylindria bacterium]